MPPKKKGHTLRGKQKVFRHAVEHVRLGLGHTVLGNLNLGLAASSTTAAEGTSAGPRPAFYTELNEQLLSHSSKDFKKFRWEVLELCETVPLFQLHHRQLAQKLLERLMDRGTHRAGEEAAEQDAKAGKKAGRADKQRGSDGATTQAYEAFARLTIAFVRDMGVKFLPYYQIFQQSIQAGMYDQAGHLIVDTSRLQLVFAVQAAWCRELRNCWADPAQLPLVRRIVRQYVGQLHDTKEYVRRLSAELLAFLCRLCRPLLPLIVEEACGDVLRAYETEAVAAAEEGDEATPESDSDAEEGDEGDAEDDDDDDGDAASSADGAADASPSIWTNEMQLLAFTRNTLPHHPVVDGLTFFVAELFRGVRGALSSSFETHYVRLLYAFHLLDVASTGETGTAGEGAAEGSASAPSRSSVNVVRVLHAQRHPLAAYLDAASDDEDDADGAVTESARTGRKTAAPTVASASDRRRQRRNADLHTTRWPTVFEAAEAAQSDEADGEGATLSSSDDLAGARRLLRQVGALTLGSAVATVLRETKKQSSLLPPGGSAAADSGEEEEEDSDESAGEAEEADALTAASQGHGSMRPSHRVLTAVVLCFTSAARQASASYIQLLVAVMNAVNFALWADGREAALLKQLAALLLSTLKSHALPKASARRSAAAPAGPGAVTASLEAAAAVLRLLSPLCLSPYLGAASTAASSSSYVLQLQQWFVPVAKAAVQTCARVAALAATDAAAVPCQLQEEAEQVLFAFAQDVLQKNYAFAIEQERRIAEEADVRGVEAPAGRGSSSRAVEAREDVYVSEDDDDDGDHANGGALRSAQARTTRTRHHQIPSFLTPFALTLLHTIGMGVWQRATADLRGIEQDAVSASAPAVAAFRRCNVQRAVLLSRLLQDHTQHMSVSPLQQLLRLKTLSSPTSDGAVAEKSVTLRSVLESLVLQLLHYYQACSQAAAAPRRRDAGEAMSYVTCALPLVQLLVTTHAPESTATSSPVRAALLRLLESIESQEKTKAGESQPQGGLLDLAAYALYAEVAAMLVQQTNASGAGRRSTAKQRRSKAKPAGTASSVDAVVADDEGLRHLCRTVSVLVHGFQQLHASATVAGEAEFTAGAAAAISDDARVQLLHGAEVLLHALLWMLGLDSDSEKASATEEGQLSTHTRAALHTLRAALPAALHEPFVQHVLLECLAAPITGLRLHALRLLRLLCHPALEDGDRLTGTPAVPLDLLDALLRAAEFNPLSHTGNLDGLQQELSRLSFKVESGAVTNAFERLLIARTMVGFLYVKFTGAWTVASKMLCWLVAQEETSLITAPRDKDDDEEERGNDETVPESREERGSDGGRGASAVGGAAPSSSRRTRLPPVVWNSVICVYARSLILGDVMPAATSDETTEGQRDADEGDVADSAAEDAAVAVARCGAQLAQLPCLYELRLTDQQRHAKGELVSRAFSSAQYATSAFTLLESAKEDFEVVRWGLHWAPASSHQLLGVEGDEATETKRRRLASGSNSGGAASAALYATSTDRSTLAQTFLSIMETMVKSSSAVDRKVRLVEDVVLELVALERNRHPSGIDTSQLRKFDQRLELAMRACGAAPTGVPSAQQRKRLSEAAQHDVDSRNAALQAIFISYLSEGNARLQRVAVDNLKRLRVEPYHTYHAKLLPYCDTMKSLFTFLSTFHVESDVPAHDRVSYVSAALSLALPKLLTKVSKDKLKDQAVLSRRMMGYLEHLPPHRAADARDPLAEVFDQLLHRLLAFAMPGDSASPAAAAPTTVDAYDFAGNVWEEIVYCGCGRRPPARAGGAEAAPVDAGAEVRRRTGLHGVRRLERLLKQLGSALRLLEAMLHAVGQRFSVYVSTCLHVALQAYLVASKQVLRRSVDALAATLPAPTSATSTASAEEERALRWVAFLNKSLASSTLSSALSHVRRAAVSIVALLSEQFPEELMDTLRGDADASSGTPKSATASALFTHYLQTLFDNSRGTTIDGTTSGGGSAALTTKSSVTPVLRLLMAWVRSPALLPLFPAYAPVVVGTLDEVFAVNAAATSVHRASTQAVYEGLRCVSEMLSCAEEPVDVTAVRLGADGGIPQRQRRGAARAPAAVVTFRECFLDRHIVGVFTSLYHLLTSGAAREEADAAANASPATAAAEDEDEDAPAVASAERRPRGQPASSAKAAKGRRGAAQRDGKKRRPTSIMSLSVAMWREVMRTVSQLTQFLHADATAAAVSATPAASTTSLAGMISRLLELALKMIAHPVCMTDASTAQMVTSVTQALMEQVPAITHREHWQPLVRLFNVVPNPQARASLCAILASAVTKLPAPELSFVAASQPDTAAQERCFHDQLAAAARAVRCLNSFESEETYDRYDFDLRYHTLHSLHDFFAQFGNYGALQRGGASSHNGSAVRKERAYEGGEDVRLPLDKDHAPVLAPEAVAVLAANVMFFLRDPEQTIRALVLPLLQSMVRYASLGGQRPTGAADGRRGGSARRRSAATGSEETVASAGEQSAVAAAQVAYRTHLLEATLRHEVLGSLRRGVVAKDVHIRCAHMQAFEGFARYFSAEFPSFALLYSPNTEQNFYANVGHVQHRCRLHALALLRQHAADMHVRDLLRVFVPFSMSAVKDFAEGKRNQANLTEGRARGYCDAVLLTISSIAARLPWTAYYRVLSLFLSNASANANLRATMLRGVVQVLNTFHFLQDSEEEEEGEEGEGGAEPAAAVDEDDEDEVNDDDAAVRAELTRKQREFRHAKVMRVLEADVLPQLYSYIGDKESKSMTGRGVANQHSITAVRREQQREDAASSQVKNALLQLPVAMAITKIVKHFPEDRFNVHVDHLLDELIKKLRTKNDKHRESARRILGAMLQETGPSKLRFVVMKLKDNLVHGYQLHVLGYTVVTLLYQLYEPNSLLLRTHGAKTAAQSSAGAHGRGGGGAHDPVQEALEAAKKARTSANGDEAADSAEAAPPRRRARREGDDADEESPTPAKEVAVDEDTAVEQAEEALLRELGTMSHASFDFQYGIDCLTKVLEELLLIFLDDYLGEVGIQKEQVEVMSTMIEVKRNRALQGFAFLGKHCDAATVMEAFLQRITWVLTPPADNTVSASELHGSARARALLTQEMKNKFLTTSKGGSADLVFVNKVRLLAVRVARSLMANPTMSVEKSFEQVRRLLEQHNRTREEKVSAFEAKEGTRRIRGNAHLILHKADRHSRKEQLEQNFLVAPVPERVDVDFSAHTVLATQQKQKLRVYRGRYGKEVKEAAKNFYREDPVTAVVLDTLDEFLLKFLLSVLKQVLGIGKEKRYSKAAMKLDMLRHHREKQRQRADGEGAESGEEEEEEGHEGEENAEERPSKPDETDAAAQDEEADEEAEEDDGETAAVENDDGDEDGLGTFAEAQTVAEGEAKSSRQRSGKQGNSAAALLAPGSDLTVTFTREHRALLESLVPAVLTCLQGEGSDAVVANALDCLLALVSLRPPLDAINDLQKELFETVTSFIERGSVIKQRAIRLTAAMVAHQKYVVSEANAVQLVKLVRAEVMERNEFMSVSLSLLYAVLGKHVHVAEIYDLMDVITELLLHWSARRVIRRRCILILTRFLLEYRLTPEKFKSHIDLYCRNLDYPELTGRTALLELLDALIVRLPAVILREEAPVLLVPLAATVTGSEWVECRKQGGAVLQHLARYAGVDVLVPVLSSWMAAAQPRATRTMAVQTWSTILPALVEFYGLGGDQAADEDEEAAQQNREAFQACCAWSVEAVLAGCLFDQVAAAHRNKRLDQLTAKAKEKVELSGWAYIFYSLRAAEAMLAALPNELCPLLAPRLLPRITEALMVHTHPWVRAAATRVLRHYLYAYVEGQSHYLQEDVWQGLASQRDTPAEPEEATDDALPYVLDVSRLGARAAVTAALATLQSFASLLKRVLGLVSASDVAMETYNAHRAINDPARGELLKVAVYALRAMVQLSLFALTQSSLAASAAEGAAQLQRRQRFSKDVQQRVRATFVSLQHQLQSLISPVVKQNSLVNYMVRSATLLQLLGGWISVLPHELAAANDDEAAEAQQSGHGSTYNSRVCWLSQQLLCPTAMLQQCVLPLLALGLRAKPISEKISLISYQVAGVVQQQLDERRSELTTPVSTRVAAEEPSAAVGAKRRRSEDDGDAAGLGAEDSHGVPLDDVLVSLKTQLAGIHDARRDQQVVQTTKKAMKRSRREMETEAKRHDQQRRPSFAKSRDGAGASSKKKAGGGGMMKTRRRGA